MPRPSIPRSLLPAIVLTALAIAGATYLAPARTAAAAPSRGAPAPHVGNPAPSWSNASWLNASAPVTVESLRGHVVLVNFWVFTCINCKRSIPSLVRFDSLYRAKGLSLVGIHTPEFPPYAGEHDRANVARAIAQHGIRYPVAQDNDRRTWHQYDIHYWPSFVLIDKRGQIRYEGYGEIHVGDANDRIWQTRIESLLAETP